MTTELARQTAKVRQARMNMGMPAYSRPVAKVMSLDPPAQPDALPLHEPRLVMIPKSHPIFSVPQDAPVTNWEPRHVTIIREVMDRYDITLADLQGPGRARRLVFPRQELFFRLRYDCHWSSVKIGEFFNRDHATVIHGCKAHLNRAGK